MSDYEPPDPYDQLFANERERFRAMDEKLEMPIWVPLFYLVICIIIGCVIGFVALEYMMKGPPPG
jgi:hypothetical protein